MMEVKVKAGVELTFLQEICHREMEQSQIFLEDLGIVEHLLEVILVTTTVISETLVIL